MSVETCPVCDDPGCRVVHEVVDAAQLVAANEQIAALTAELAEERDRGEERVLYWTAKYACVRADVLAHERRWATLRGYVEAAEMAPTTTDAQYILRRMTELEQKGGA